MNYAIILSGGVGTRMGLDVPKQYYRVAGKPIIQYGMDTIESIQMINGYVIVAAREWHGFILENTVRSTKFIGFAEPGRNRQLSIYHGLQILKKYAQEDDLVLIQDAARPNTTEKLIKRCLSIGLKQDGAMPILRMKDTIYVSHSGRKIDSLLKREELFAGQAPEAFRFGKYLKANEQLLPEEIMKIDGSTEPAVMYGMNISLVNGEESNFKITTIEDLGYFQQQVEENQR